MATYFVTRHSGAADWVHQQGIHARLVRHLDDRMIKPGDIVLGTLPLQAVSKIGAKGARYFHLEMEVPECLRGQELSAQDMDDLGAKLVEYEVIRKRRWRK